MQRLLYYPLINPPTLIVWQGLLYWDGIASITPHGENYFEPLLRDLSDTHLYRGLYADTIQGADPEWYSHMLQELEAVVSGIPREDLEPKPGPLDVTNRLFYGKVPWVLEKELIRIGAAQEAGSHLRINPRLGLAILTVIAKHLAQAYSDDTTTYLPHTDLRQAHRIAFDPLAQAGGGQRCWQVQVGAVLPIPASDTPLETVLKFRDDYEEERTRLRIALYRLFKELEGIGNPNDVQTAIAQQINDAVRDMEKALRGRRIAWIKRILYALVGLGAAVAPPLAGATATITAAGGAAGGAAINLATSQTRNPIPGEFAYLHELQKAFPSAGPPSPTRR